MLKQIFIWVGIALLAAMLILFFINGGGFSAIYRSATSMPSLRSIIVGTIGSGFTLPGQDQALGNIGLTIDTSGGSATYAAPAPASVNAPTALQTYGAPSASEGSVTVSAGNSIASNPRDEYVVLTASITNSAPVDISGWSLQSVYSGTRAYIPLAASPFILGVVNRVADVSLAPGESAIFTSGISPIGVSFRETLCTGYLNQMQAFTPALANSCPTANRVVDYSAATVARYGADCFQYLQTLPQCTYPNAVPPTLSNNCRALLATAFSYNGCVQQFKGAADFALPSYRLYGNFTRELWGNDHDVIRLLDKEGHTVDAASY